MAREQATSLTEDDDIQDGEEELVIIEQEPEAEESYEDAPQKVSAEDDERDSIRERRRAEKQERKERREQAIKRDKLELDFLRKRNDDLERRLSAQEYRSFQSDLGSFDAQINQAAKEAEMAERVIAKAVEAGNGADVTQAMRYRDQAIAKIQQLNYAKQQTQQVAVQRAQQPPPVDDLTMHYANEFIKENPWYDAQGRDEDSAIVLAIDQSLAKDGFDPKTEDYWDELRRRAARRLPDKFGNERQARQPRGGPVVGSGREHAPASTKKDVYISPERKQALIDAGVWDDPVLRMKYVKRYAEYDRNRRS